MSDEIITVTDVNEEFLHRLEQKLLTTPLRAGSSSPEPRREPDWAVTTTYGETFRAIMFDGEQDAAFAPAPILTAARRISGLDEVMVFRAQANAMLAGSGLGRHTDVPEFRGARRWSFPDWLLVTMLHSGRFDGRQIRVVSALVWPIETNGGALDVYDRADRSRVARFEPVPGTAVVFDTCRLPHHVAAVPGDEVVVGDGDRITLTAGGGWRLERADGATAMLARRDVRASVLVKVACFADAGQRAAHLARAEESLDQDAVVAELTGAAGPVGSRQELVDHFVSYR